MTRPPLYAYSLVSPFILSLINLSIASVPTLDLDSPQPIAECAEDTFTWGGGLPPYTLSLRDAHSGTSIFSNSSLTDTTFHWIAAVAAGTSLIVELTDTGENGAGPARLSDSFTVEPGSDSCLSSASATSSSSSTSTTQQTSDSSTSTLSTSTSPSTSSEQPTASPSSSSPPTSPSGSTTLATTNASPSASASASSSGSSASATGAPAGSTAGSASGRTGPDGSSTTPTSPSGSPAPSSPGTGRSPTAGAIAGAAVGSLVAGFVLATGLFCAWRASMRMRRGAAVFKFGTRQRQRQRRGRLEPYEYPSAGSARTVRLATSNSRPHDAPLDLEGGTHRLDANFVVTRERQRPGKLGHRDSFVLPSTQPTTFGRQRSRADDATVVNVADRSRVMDMDRAGGGQEIQSGDVVGRRWEFGEPDDLDAFNFSEHSTSTAPPPYSQIA